MAKKEQKKPQPDGNWKKFVDDSLVEKHINAKDIVTPDGELTSYSNEFPKEALVTIKQCLTPDAYRRLHGRWRKYKYAATHNITTITLRRETLLKLKLLAEKAGFEDENYDLYLEYLMDPEGEMDPAKIEVDELGLPSALNMDLRAQMLRVQLRFRQSTWKYVLGMVEYAFTSGWLACKALHAKKRTVEASDAAAKKFLDKLKGL